MHRVSCRFGLLGVIFLSLFLFFSTTVLAQSTAMLQGTVTDQKGAAVPSASVVVRNKATSLERTTQTDTEGNYQVAALPTGTYSVEVRLRGQE